MLNIDINLSSLEILIQKRSPDSLGTQRENDPNSVSAIIENLAGFAKFLEGFEVGLAF